MLMIKTACTRKDLLDFASLPLYIYRQERFGPAISPSEILQMLNPAFNPIWSHASYRCFLAVKNNQHAGRVAAVIDRYNLAPETGFFGAFEAIDNFEVVHVLLEAAQKWLASHGVKKVWGPATFNTNQQVGILIEGFEKAPQPLMPYNPPYYQKLIEDCGFSKLTDLLSYSFSLKKEIPPLIVKIADRASKKEGLKLYSLNRDSLETVKYILNKAMVQNWGYIPLTYTEVGSMINYCFTRGDPSLVLIATVGLKPAALSITFPLCQNTARMAILAVVPEFRLGGLECLLIKSTAERLKEKGYLRIELSQIEEKNTMMMKTIAKFSCQLIKRHRVYQKVI